MAADAAHPALAPPRALTHLQVGSLLVLVAALG